MSDVPPASGDPESGIPTIDPTDDFLRAADDYGLGFEPGDLEQLGLYLGLLLDANTRQNLTAIRQPNDAWIRHIFDSLTLLPLLDPYRGGELADVGSGGGVPGIPLAIVIPDLRVTMVESTGKKVAFLKTAISRLGLPNAHAIQERAETLGRETQHRGRYGVVTARAVGHLRILLELCAPLCAVGGQMFLIKGERADDEIEEASKAIHVLGLSLEGVLRTPTGRVVIVNKDHPTPEKYPRRDGEPKRAPL